jgi:para-nitrobenzyl esterase
MIIRIRRSACSYSVRCILVFCAAFMVLLSGCSSLKSLQGTDSAQVGVERRTSEGIVIGEENIATNTISWKSIPYARPPIGDLRWKAPQPPQKRSAALKAAAFCEICPQYTDHDLNIATPQIISGNEDCLYLNIWSPKKAKGNLPVFFWIHGGGNSTQWPLLSRHDGGILANKGNMVVITVNYRLGPMGFMNHPALKTGDDLGDSGNFGLLDLITALKWVQANIKHFGGNPRNVTIAGESSGAVNVLFFVASPMAKGLFHRAIAQSPGLGLYPLTPAQGAAQIDTIIAKFLVKDGKAGDPKAAATMLAAMPAKEVEAYLRSKKAQDFLEMYPEGKAGIMIQISFGDGKLLPKDFYAALESGNYNKVPMILGTNKEENKLYLRYPPFASWIKDGSLYKDPAKQDLYNLTDKYASDAWKLMVIDYPASLMRGHSNQPKFFAYQFLWGAGGAKNNVIDPPLNILLGACHGMEIDFVFGTENLALGSYVFKDKNRPGRVALSNAMMNYWSEFARTGNPNRDQSGLPKWSPWSNTKDQPKIILLDADLEKIKIAMSNIELTKPDIEAALKAEPRQKEIQPAWDKSPFWKK